MSSGRRAALAQPLSLTGAVVPSVLVEDPVMGLLHRHCCYLSGVRWTLLSSELTVRDLFSCIFIQSCCSALGSLFWLLKDPGNMINGCLAYVSHYISPPCSAWDDRLGFPSPVCCLLNSSCYWFFNYVFPQIVRITFSFRSMGQLSSTLAAFWKVVSGWDSQSRL